MLTCRLLLALWGLLALLRRLLVTHLMVLNEGSRTPQAAFEIADVTLAQAFYGSLGAGEADHYRFAVAEPTPLRLSLLVPEHHHAAGFRPVVTLSTPEDERAPLRLEAGDEGMRTGTTTYRRTQRAEPLLKPGQYQVEVWSASTGVYCFCVGTREPAEYADAATRARVQALVSG